MSLILASNSVSRKQLLKNAGIPFCPISSNVDEAAIKTQCQLKSSGPVIAAMEIAKAKARAVSYKFPDDLVLAADQILICNDKWFDKPVGLNGIRAHLEQLSGQTHELINATVIMERSVSIWHHENTVSIEMRPLSSELISSYLEKVGETACESVGAYQIEGPGIQLLHHTHGDFFSILGLPLFPLLEFLRSRDVVPR